MAQGDVKSSFGAKTAVTVTLTSLANNNARESTMVDNATNKFIDAMLRIKTNGQASGTSVVNVWLYSSLGDTTYTDGATGSDAAFTAANVKNAILLDTVQMNAATAVTWGPKSIVRLANLIVLPDRWGLIFENKSGAALSATAGDHVIEFEGAFYNVAPS